MYVLKSFLTALTNPDLANSQELTDWMVGRMNRADKRNQLLVFDAVVSGEMFEMSGERPSSRPAYREERGMRPVLHLRSIYLV